MEDGAPTLEVGFEIATGQSFAALKTLDDMIGTTAADAVRDFQKVENASRGAVNLGGASAAVRTLRDDLGIMTQATARVEKSGEGMVRQLARQAESFGKTASQIRQMRAEMRAVAAEDKGLTSLADRIRTASAEMDRLEAAGGNAAGGVKKTGGAMAALAPQAQDLFTQMSMGGNVLNAFAIQSGQAAGQMIYMEGAAGKVGRFMLGPWGLAFTAAALAAGPLWNIIKGTNDAIDEEVDKLKKSAVESEKTTARR